MEAEVMNRLYEVKYKAILSYERYKELLEKGLSLIKEKSSRTKCSPTEQSALEIGLDYITEVKLKK